MPEVTPTTLETEPLEGTAAQGTGDATQGAAEKAKKAKKLKLADAHGNVVEATKWREDDEAYHIEKGSINGDPLENHAFDKTQWNKK